MTDERYSHIIKSIMAMDYLVHGFNDEEWVEPWLMDGVTDGLEYRSDYELTYPNDNDLEETYADLTALFCRLIARQAASIKMPENGTDFPPVLKISGGDIII